jgi:hypothetical protein
VSRHDLDPVSLVAGLVFVILAIAFLLDEAGTIRLRSALVGPVLLIGLGVAGLVGSAPRHRR